MPKIATPDPAFPVRCKHCDGALFGRVKFCPYCGEDESVAFETGAARPTGGFKRGTPDRVETAPIAAAAAAPKRDEVRPQPEIRVAPGPGTAKAQPAVVPEATRTETAAAGPALQTASSAHPVATPPLAQAPLPVPEGKPRGIGKWIALALIALAATFGYFYFSEQRKIAVDEQIRKEQRSREIAAKLAQAQSAFSRGDLTAAERTLAALLAENPDNPGARDLKNKIDERMREQRAKREQQLRDANLNAARALGLDKPPAPSPTQAPPAPATPIFRPPRPVIVAPAPQPPPVVSQADPRQIECDAMVRAGRRALQTKSYDQAVANANDALAALALCPGAQQLKRDAARAKQKAIDDTVIE